MTERRKVDWRGVGLYRADGSALEENTTEARALAERRAALTELRTTGQMSTARFVPPRGADFPPWVADAEGYTAAEIDWTAFDLRFDLHLMPAAPGATPELLGSFDSPDLAAAAGKRYVKKNPGTRVEVTTAKREDA